MSEVSRRSDYERSDASPPLLAALAGGFALFVVSATLVTALIYPNTLRQADVGRIPTPGGPRLQTDPEADLAAFRQAETEQLTHYAWIDRAGGRVRIPIARALALTAERGLPGWQKP
jgi:hypothetical protein